MGAPKFNHGTCRNCGNRVVYKVKEMSEKQKAENEEARLYNVANKLGRYDKDYKYPPHEEYYYYSGSRWTHMPEEPGEDKVFCEGQDESNRRQRAVPREFCMDSLNSGETCHKQVKMEVEGIGYCVMHGKRHAEAAEHREHQEQEMALRKWAEEAFNQRLATFNEKFGMNVQQGFAYNETVEVDAKVLMDMIAPGATEAFAEAQESYKNSKLALEELYRRIRSELDEQLEAARDTMRDLQEQMSMQGFRGGRYATTYRVPLEKLEEFVAGRIGRD